MEFENDWEREKKIKFNLVLCKDVILAYSHTFISLEKNVS